jgi:cation diffusion facilitator family transporter
MANERSEIHLPEDKKKLFEDVKHLEKMSIFFLVSGVAALGLTMGSSQAMKTMWLEDLLSLIPTSAVLVGIYIRRWQPDDTFNYGYRRVVQIGFLAGAVALFGFGAYLFLDSVYTLIIGHRATIQTMDIFGTRVWLGWLMIAALVYSSIPPLIHGRRKKPLATELHDKALDTDATIDKGDWLSGVAAVAGILGIGLGYWWADPLAAGFISFEIIRDGWKALRNSTVHLMDMQPTTVDEAEPDEVIGRVRDEIEALAWVRDSQIRLREVGDMIAGEAFVVPDDGRVNLEQLGDAGERVKALDWRIQDFNIVPVSSLSQGADGERPRTER